ncbi:8453_t:CDS:2 [Ambispora gerdemannii]|uniref:8453_t:CDS:1 n=1 Tax=Ambispora gerdemannii TaxID=144530 RepID=A0A9N8VRB6_9GLOM|nr:8453_t:CDS:2 [Ambispora gerdemannii]
MTFVVSQNSNSNSTVSDNTNNSTSIVDDKCAKFFGVSKCSPCQKTTYGAFDEHLSNCFESHNVTLGLRKSCSTLPCDETAIETLNVNIQKDCQQELIDWTKSGGINDPKNIAPELWFLIYRVIPDNLAICSQASGSYCAINVRSRVVNHILSLLKPGQSTSFNITISPPSGMVLYGNPENQVHVQIPTDIICSDCYSKLAQPWIDFFKMNTSSISAVQSFLDNYIAPVKSNLTQCPTNSKESGGTQASPSTPINSGETVKVYWNLVSALTLNVIVYYLKLM